MSDNKTQVDLYIGHGVVAHGVALVPGRAVVNGIFDGAIDSKELEIQTDGVVQEQLKLLQFLFLVDSMILSMQQVHF